MPTGGGDSPKGLLGKKNHSPLVMEVIPIDSLQLTVFALSAWYLHIHVLARNRNMKMANSPENSLLSAGAAVRGFSC